MTIEDLIDFDKNHLTDYKLIYSKMGKTWYWFYVASSFLSIMTIIFTVFMIGSFKNPDYRWLILIIPVIVALVPLVSKFKKKTASILKEYNEKFNLNSKVAGSSFKDRQIISKIQYLLLSEYLKAGNIKLTKDDLNKIIDALKSESSNTRYNYQSLTIILAFITIVTSAFLGSWLQIKLSIDNLINIATKSIILLVGMSFIIVYIEEYIVKDVIKNRRNRYQRLIRVLENYSINLIT